MFSRSRESCRVECCDMIKPLITYWNETEPHRRKFLGSSNDEWNGKAKRRLNFIIISILLTQQAAR